VKTQKEVVEVLSSRREGEPRNPRNPGRQERRQVREAGSRQAAGRQGPSLVRERVREF